MYVSGNRNNQRIVPPAAYSGRAIRTDDVLAEAEEMFRRGYVFEDEGREATEVVAVAAETEDICRSETESCKMPPDTENEPLSEPLAVPVSGTGKELKSDVSHGNMLTNLFGKITAEHIIIIAAMLILLDSRADDELLIMLAVLLFC